MFLKNVRISWNLTNRMQLKTDDKLNILNKKGFTLVEVMSVIVIMGVMLSVGVQKLDLLSTSATDQVLESVIKELNTRETLIWTKIKLSDSGWTTDTIVFTELDTNLGPEFKWTVEPNDTGGTLQFRSKSVALTRTASSILSAAKWE